MSMFSTQTAESLECPKCGKRTIVQGGGYQFHCLNCNFHRDLSSKLSSRRSHDSARGSEHRSSGHRSKDSSRSRGRDSGRSDFSSRDFGGLDTGRGSREMGLSSREFAMPSRDRESEMNPFLFVAIAIIFGLLVL
ncbi:MAG: hypothetical protein AAF152_09785 [Cyanobacteria bacterium P01_A01_bin.114]